VKKLEFNRNELAGSLGDLGLFVPIAASLVMMNKMNATSVFVCAGLFYIFAGLYFNIPTPVQPFKAVASIAIALSLGPKIISASGIVMGIILAVINITPLSKYLAKMFSKPVVRGIQLVIGLFLIRAGYSLLSKNQLFFYKTAVTGNMFFINLLIALFAFGLIIIFRKNEKIPASLTVLSFGLVIGIIFGGLRAISQVKFGPQPVLFSVPSMKDFYIALTLLVIAQLPVTLANSVVATTDVAEKYFKDRAKRVKPKTLLTSISAANFIFGFFGAMPMCHGAGGMTAHYKFGAKTAGSNIIIGGLFLTLGLVFGKFAISILSIIPMPVYAVLLIYLGVQHGLLITDLAKKRNYLVTVGMGLLAFISQNLVLAIGMGYFADMVMNILVPSNG
jgi:SulP family sulfate permease